MAPPPGGPVVVPTDGAGALRRSGARTPHDADAISHLAGPSHVCALTRPGTEEPHLAAELPPADGPFVGRAATLAAIAEVAAGATASGRLIVLSGEAGIGKTRIAHEAARRAATDGSRVLWGRCLGTDESPPFWPWTQILRQAVDARQAAGLAPIDLASHPVGGILGATTPIRPSAALPHDGADEARIELFDGVRLLLADLAGAGPLLVVLDDLHGADLPSLRLLSFLVRTLHATPVAVVATLRDEAVGATSTGSSLLTEVLREARRLPIRGLGPREVRKLVAAQTGQTCSPSVARSLHDLTDGNPFYVSEVTAQLSADGVPVDGERLVTPGRLPSTLRTSVHHRVRELPARTVDLLRVAAVLGRAFDVATLAATAETAMEATLEGLEPAFADAVIVDDPGVPGRFAFRHAVVREVLWEGTPVLRRLLLHRAAARALAHRDDDAAIDELARHWFAAATRGNAAEAAEACLRAGRRAGELLAFEQSARHIERALQAMELHGHPRAERVEAMLELGAAQVRAADAEGSRLTFIRAAEQAASIDAPLLRAEAVLGAVGLATSPAPGAIDEELAELLAAAADALEELAGAAEADRLSSLVLSRLVMERYHHDTDERRTEMSERALMLARSSGDDATAAFALHAHHYTNWSRQDPDARLASASAIVDLAARGDDPALEVEGTVWRYTAFLERGDLPSADAELQIVGSAAQQAHNPFVIWRSHVLHAGRSLLAGDLDDAEAHADTALAIGQENTGPEALRSFGPNARMAHRVQLLGLRREQDRLAELTEPVRALVRTHPHLWVWRGALAFLLAATDRHDEAQALVDNLAASRLDRPPHDGNWVAALTFLAEATHLIGDSDRAEVIRGHLEPLADRNVVIDQGVASRGPVTYYLGLACATTGDHDAAARWFAGARDAALQMGARAIAARTHLEWGRSARAAGRDDTAIELLAAAAVGFRDLGLEAAATRCSKEASAAAAHQSTAVAQSHDHAVFRREGEVWAVGDADAVRVRHSKGMAYLARLLAAPDVEVHSLDLASGGRLDPSAMHREDLPTASTDGLAVLDHQAKAAYRRRINELRAELDEADAGRDTARAERAAAELSSLHAALTSAVGLGGRDRKTSSDAERARVAVTKAIRGALRRIAEHHPRIGTHLSQHVRTGTYCVYLPDARNPLRWSVSTQASS